MTQLINPAAQSQAQSRRLPIPVPTPTSAENTLVAQFATDQAAAELAANFNVFAADGSVDGKATLQAQNEVLQQVVYLTNDAMTGYSVTPGKLFTTLMIDWTATLTARLSYRSTYFGI